MFLQIWDIVAHHNVESVVKRIEKKKRQTIVQKEFFNLVPVGAHLQATVAEEEVEVDEKDLDSEIESSAHELEGTKLPQSYIFPKNNKAEDYLESYANSYILERFHEACSEVLKSLLDPQDSLHLELPLHVTEEELAIINQEENVLLRGRAGTGRCYFSIVLHSHLKEKQLAAY